MSMLQLKNVSVAYGGATALHDCSLNIKAGSLVSLLGANGAGKTTTLNCIAGLVRPAKGEVRLEGADITRMHPSEIVESGLSLVPEHRQLFYEMTVEENIILGAYVHGIGKYAQRHIRQVYELFPELNPKRNDRAAMLSGGQQQMLAIGRAMMAHPRILLLDEPSLGLAPKLNERIFSAIQNIHRSGVTVLLVEQNAFKTLPLSDFAYVLDEGRVVLEGVAKGLMGDDRVRESYLGTL